MDDAVAACRKGINDAKRAQMWWFLCTQQKDVSMNRIDATYAAASKEVFGLGPIPAESVAMVPSFGQPRKSVLILDAQIELAFRRLAKIIQQLHGVTHCRMLPELLRLCLYIGLTEAQVYMMMQNLLERRHAKDDWKLPTAPAMELAIVHLIKETVAWRYPALQSAMVRQDAWSDELIAEVIQCLFLGYLPLPTVLRITDAYLAEGPKVLCRFMMAMLKLTKEKMTLVTTASGLAWWQLLSIHSQQINSDDLFAVAFRKWYGYLFRRQYMEQRAFENSKYDIDVEAEGCGLPLPLIPAPSPSLLHPVRHLLLHDWLPPSTQLKRIERVYCAVQHGRGLDTLYQKCRGSSSPMLLLVEALDTNSIIGAYTSHPLEEHDRFFGDNQTFVFTLLPDMVHYKSMVHCSSDTHVVEKYLMCRKSLLSIGIDSESSAAALEVDEMLVTGRSSQSDLYCNPPLAGVSEFEIGHVQVFKFVL